MRQSVGRVEGTVWIPRLLWALNAASLSALGPVRASGLARILEAELDQTIQGTNTARAFRDLRDHKAASTWWTEAPRGYVITDAGRATLRSMLEGRKRPRRAAKPKLASTRPAAVSVPPVKRKARGGL